MKLPLFLAALALAFTSAGSGAAPENSAADSAAAEIATRQRELQQPSEALKHDAAAYHAWAAPRQMQLLLQRFEFARNFPADPRHWASLLEAAWSGVFKADALKTYATAHAESAAQIAALLEWAGPALAALERDPAAPPEIAANLAGRRCAVALSELENAPPADAARDWPKVAAMLDALAVRAPGFSRTFLEQRLVKFVHTFAPSDAETRLHRLADDPKSNAGVREMAQTELAALRAFQAPLDLHFTALDGREVDLAKLRGKVVLVDFWATWCGPCVAELPNVKKVYAAYHDRGFEVVGVSLDRAGDRQRLVDFVAKESMPWPQYYDGKYWKNEISTRFAINSIPAMFLLDRAGRVVSTNARGEKLESTVKQLLGL